ncbi:FkbO/Hyg5 family chorismatase [Streptomyces sp. HD]|uniref:FkbO/Hyg5 family chorismatase n=1 Tax=Streptomyces sp. HD TaxID=3020892 RepID=UPI00232EDB1C|nr:FkbO/Hyg5 family chorismatase [Streptomyces sp. HD]MDC0766354.1 FkbO/Hyg5 family chorismatase [Streptomyces sp. HD]
MNPEEFPALGVINYTTRHLGPVIRDGIPQLDIHMSHTTRDGFTEVWPAQGTVLSGEDRGIVHARDGVHMFCAGRMAPAPAYVKTARDAYMTALDLLASAGYTDVFRVWNVIGRINDDNAEGLEIYRDFCRGRAEAFEACAPETSQIPAASGVGALGEGISFYLLAARPGRTTSIENPLQVPAYRYPVRYGPKSPTFARATHLRPRPAEANGADRIYVSGTAAIRGHESLHIGDVEAQCRMSLANIARLLAPGNITRHGLSGPAGLTSMRQARVYVREQADIPLVRRLCHEAFPAATDISFLNVDLCRRELLVEIEGIAHDQ